MTSLRELPIGKTATIRSVGGEGALRQHFLDMGLIPKGDVTMVKYAPMGDPMELRIHSYELTLRLADAEKIEIENIRDAKETKQKPTPLQKKAAEAMPHPGLGEGGKFHEKKDEHPLPDHVPLTFASDKLRELLDIPETETVVSVIAVGKAAESPARPPRKELDAIAKFF